MFVLVVALSKEHSSRAQTTTQVLLLHQLMVQVEHIISLKKRSKLKVHPLNILGFQPNCTIKFKYCLKMSFQFGNDFKLYSCLFFSVISNLPKCNFWSKNRHKSKQK